MPGRPGSVITARNFVIKSLCKSQRCLTWAPSSAIVSSSALAAAADYSPDSDYTPAAARAADAAAHATGLRPGRGVWCCCRGPATSRCPSARTTSTRAQYVRLAERSRCEAAQLRPVSAFLACLWPRVACIVYQPWERSSGSPDGSSHPWQENAGVAVSRHRRAPASTSKKIVTKRGDLRPEPEEEQCEHSLERERGKQQQPQ
mgnify:CR=1 FL=1